MRLIPLLFGVLLLAACGSKGPLTLPPAAGAADHSTAPGPAR